MDDSLHDEPGCGFCAEVRGRDEDNAFVALLGRERGHHCILARNSRATVMPSIGALVPGHVLVVPVDHWHSFALLPPTDLAEASSLAVATFELLAHEYDGDVVAFEHGSSDGTSTSGACSDHAHLHLLPLPGGLRESLVTAGRRWERIPSGETAITTAIRVLRGGQSYLSLWDGSNWWIRSGPSAAQEMRRVIAGTLGRPDEWDWALFPNRENVIATADALGSKLAAPVGRVEDLALNFAAIGTVSFPKFVRSGVPQLVAHLSPRVEQPSAAERIYWLAQKLIEEANEASEAILGGGVTTLKEELADVLEVIRVVVAHAELSWQDIEQAWMEKRNRVGDLDSGVVCRIRPGESTPR